MSEIRLLIKEKKENGTEAMKKKFNKIISVIDKESEKEKKKLKIKNLREFKKLIREKNMTNDFKFFQKMPLDKQGLILEQISEINKYTNIEKPYRIKLLESNMPLKFKAIALKKINTLALMDNITGEYYKIKQWVDTFMTVPFGIYKELPIRMSDGKEKCNKFMENAKHILDKSVYGLADAKMQIMQVLGQLITNPKSIGTAISILGPPGTGKTTLIKEGISKILDRPFAFIALGGATDASFLEGHSSTYEGAIWGKIVEILRQSKCMNPVIYFDELDKVSDTPKGEEIIGILTHLTDTSQNNNFHDKYFNNVDFDLSKVLFIFSYNDENKINPILKDRMYRVHTNGYNIQDKTIIASRYLIPKIEENVKFNKGDIIISDETLNYIIEQKTNSEKGVRNLKRCLEVIYTKLNLFRLMKSDSTLFDKDTLSLKVVFPYTVTSKIVNVLIKKNDINNVPQGMYV